MSSKDDEERAMLMRITLRAEQTRKEKEMEQWCPDCGREVDPDATKCPSCHYAEEAMGEGPSEGESDD